MSNRFGRRQKRRMRAAILTLGEEGTKLRMELNRVMADRTRMAINERETLDILRTLKSISMGRLEHEVGELISKAGSELLKRAIADIHASGVSGMQLLATRAPSFGRAMDAEATVLSIRIPKESIHWSCMLEVSRDLPQRKAQ